MPVMPLMPDSSSMVASPMGATPPAAPAPPGVGDPTSALASLLNGAGPMGPGAQDPLQGALGQFDQLAQQIADLARVFPATSQSASQMMEILDQWRQQVLITLTPQSSSMPGADQMM